MNDERAPVSFAVAKPVNPKTRHPFSGEPLEAAIAAVEEYNTHPALDTPIPATDSNPIRQAIAALRLQREKLDRAIETLEELA